MLAERHFHLDRLADTDDEAEGRDHKIIARWLKQFMEVIPEEVEGLYQSAKEKQNNPEKKVDLSTGTPWMEDDGTEDEPAEV